MQHDHALIKLNFDLLIPSQGSGSQRREGVGWCGQNICYHVVAFRDHVRKKMNFGRLTPSPMVFVAGGSAGKIFATMLLHFVIPFDVISNMTVF